ncbi:TRAM domain-containing protein [Lysinibacter cavernae]|uniref:tRNA/tmRNA/rRNA uracil-C5-methylase (TrmA/RlmC/RlmD family) n=1 Tax=Lysinibacter cavernae TaxID=1640652 RepID=A0A7X5R3T2_9MICO|nr:tRNA/tmRNA/rRNA uracil-C5-methylase (TrmA/RlmC/RlmD family) [Lysinibacter cavernae]
MNANGNPKTSADLSVGDELELDVTNVAHGGIFVARHEGRVVFVSDAIPGERVLARVTEARKKSFVRASVVRVLEASPHRRDHVWASADVSRDPAHRVGGAEFGHIDLAEQRRLLGEVITDSLKRMAGIDLVVPVEPAPGDDERNGLGWRTRMSLHANDRGQVGPYAARSHDIIRVKDYPLAHPEVETLALGIKANSTAAKAFDVVAPSASPPFVVISEDSKRPRKGHSRIRERVGEREFELAKTGFWQVHREAPAVLTAAVQSAIDENLFEPSAMNLDLYGGVGLLAAAVLDRFEQGTDETGRNIQVSMTTVESDPVATECAANNLKKSAGALAETARVDRYLGFLERTATAESAERMRKATVILDPPRSGAGGQVCESLLNLAPAQLIYVACDPVAFARDAKTLTEGGYVISGIRAFDLFPHTHHVEIVASLVRADLVE